MIILQRLAKLQAICPKQLVSRSVFLVHHQGQFVPKQHRLPWKPHQKAILYNKKTRLIPKIDLEYCDPIVLPGYDENNIIDLMFEFNERKLPLSPTTLCMLIHMFSKYNVMNEDSLNQIEKQAYRFKGEYRIRSIFGGLQGSITYHRTKLRSFFLQEYAAANEKFTMIQIIQTMEALIKNKMISQDQKQKIWKDNFRADFLEGFHTLRVKQTSVLTRVFDMFRNLGEADKRAWSKLLQVLKGKKGWARIPVIERLYSISGENARAKAIFDTYFESMSQDQDILQRYNLTQLRFHSPLELIKYAQQNPSDFYPKIRTLIPEKENAQQWNEKYEQYLKVGAVKQQQQIIKDKSKSLGFAIRERYDTMEDDNIDFTKMGKEEFEEMFGNFDETMETIRQEDIKISELEKAQAEKTEKQQESEPAKGKKAKGKQNTDGKPDKTEKAEKAAKPGKEKKEKAKPEQ